MPPFPSAKGREEAIDEGAQFGRWVCSWTRPLWHSTWNVAHVTLQPPSHKVPGTQCSPTFILPASPACLPASLLLLPTFWKQNPSPAPTLCPSSTGLWQEALGGSSHLRFSHACPFISLPEQSIWELLRGKTGLHLLFPPSAGMRKAVVHVANQGCSYFMARSPTRLCLPRSQPTLTSSRTSVLTSRFPLYLIFSPYSPGTQHLGEGPNILTLQILSPSTLKAFPFTYQNYSAAWRWNTERFFIHINIRVRSVLETWFCHLLVIWFAAKFNFLSEKWVW